MNLEFSADDEAMRRAFRELLATSRPRAAFDGERDPGGMGDGALWRRLADGGWLATAIPEAHGGSGLDAVALCVLAEEAGRHLAAVPLTASACSFTHALLGFTGDAAVRALLPRLADGSARGVLLTDDCWPRSAELRDSAAGPAVVGRARNVLDGAAVTHALALAGAGGDAGLALVEIGEAARRPPAASPLDLLHPCCDLDLMAQPAHLLARGDAARAAWDRMRDHHALFVAFEQLGGAEAALESARRYSLQRYAFGRPIGSFQALKHLMADMLVSIALARANCCFGAAALGGDDRVLSEAAAVARISATEAFRSCASGGTQVHGALGVTWESDCHLYYRRAQVLAGSPGSLRSWKERLVALLRERAAHLSSTPACGTS
jgi:alkylation response protein AidB-like acyl-CoA dehydrogenase